MTILILLLDCLNLSHYCSMGSGMGINQTEARRWRYFEQSIALLDLNELELDFVNTVLNNVRS